MIDHTSLKAVTSKDQVQRLCEEAVKYQFYSVCVNSYFVPFVKELLFGSSVKICTVVGFPLGASTMETKRFEAMKAMADGAHEIDMVINLSAVKSNEWNDVKDDITSLVRITHQQGGLLKVILETALLNNEEKKRICQLSEEAGADFIKTSTGFSSSGATVDDIRLMRECTHNIAIKASGGIKDYKTAMQMIQAGATRLGTSSSVEIMKESPISD